jgi:hypothetical protein
MQSWQHQERNSERNDKEYSFSPDAEVSTSSAFRITTFGEVGTQNNVIYNNQNCVQQIQNLIPTYNFRIMTAIQHFIYRSKQISSKYVPNRSYYTVTPSAWTENPSYRLRIMSKCFSCLLFYTKRLLLHRHMRESYLLTYSWSWALLEEPPILQLLKNFPAFTEPEGPLPCSQEPSTGP